MSSFYINLAKVPEELKNGITEIQDFISVSFRNKKNIEIIFIKNTSDSIKVYSDGKKIRLEYNQLNDAFRALGLINARSAEELKNISLCEKRRIEKTFIMLDASRNAVPLEKTIRRWLAFLALAGINGFMLYTEDTYEVPGEKMFGYMRGALSIEELRRCDQLAVKFGIEMIPCIQTLGHMERVLQHEKYNSITDTSAVVLCEEDETYKCLEKIIIAASTPYNSKRIHIGMDEAWDLGRGKYLDRKGCVKPYEIIVKHLDKVLEITRKLGLEPMIWGDMFFRALSETHNYYDPEIVITEDLRKQIPRDVDLIYWDYYHLEVSDYLKMIDKYIEIGKVPIVAPSIWTSRRFWAVYEHSRNTIIPCMKASIQRNVKDFIFTIWGDDGSECDFISTFPMIQLAADYIFTGKEDMDYTRQNLKGSAGIDYDDWALAGKIDEIPPENYMSNITKALLWEDPMLGLWQPQLNGQSLNKHYSELSAGIKKVLNKKSNRRLKVPYLLLEILSLKADLPVIAQKAYLKHNMKKLREIHDKTIPAILKKIRQLRDFHRSMWLETNKPFGWEVLERRYGGLYAVMENMRFRLHSCLTGKIERIEELEEKRVPIYERDKVPCITSWKTSVSTGHGL